MTKVPRLLCALSLLGLTWSASADEPLQLLTPATGPADANQARAAAVRETDDSRVVRRGWVTLDIDALLPVSPETGRRQVARAAYRARTLTLEPFTDEPLDVLIASESRPSTDSLTLIGTPAGADLAGFSLFADPKHYLITLDDPKHQRRYRIVGDSRTGIGEVREIDLTLPTHIIHLPPLVPPTTTD